MVAAPLQRFLASCSFDFVAEFGQFCLHFVAVVALNFDCAVFDSAAGATEFLQSLGQGCDFSGGGGDTGDDGDCFAAAVLFVTHDANDAVALSGGLLPSCRLIAAAFCVGEPAAGAGIASSAIGRVNKAVWHFDHSFHGFAYENCIIIGKGSGNRSGANTESL